MLKIGQNMILYNKKSPINRTLFYLSRTDKSVVKFTLILTQYVILDRNNNINVSLERRIVNKKWNII